MRKWYRNRHTGTLAYIRYNANGYAMYCARGYVGTWNKNCFDKDWELVDLLHRWRSITQAVQTLGADVPLDGEYLDLMEWYLRSDQVLLMLIKLRSDTVSMLTGERGKQE